jgi:carboxylesterase type B
MLGNLPGNAAFAWTPEDHALSAQMQAYVVNFIRTGSPDGDGLPAWPALGAGASGESGTSGMSGVSKEATPVMRFDTRSHIDYPDDLARFRFQDAQANQAK